MENLTDIFQKLGIDTSNGLYYTNDNDWKQTLQLPNRIGWLLEKIHPDAFFVFDNKPLILFFDNPVKDQNKLHEEIWNFNESPVVIISQKGAVEIWNGFSIDEKTKLLRSISSDRLTDFTYFELVTGKTWEKYQHELHYKNRVDYRLLSNIKAARKLILSEFPEIEDEKVKQQQIKITNALLGKAVFIKYLIDRKIKLNFEDKPSVWTVDDFCRLLENPHDVVRFFHYLADEHKGFNGDLFPLKETEYQQIPEKAYSIIIRLLQSEDIKDGQKSLFDLYDFSIIPIEFISNVYESFVGVENQAQEGVYYTPLFLVDYILAETVTKFIQSEHTYSCKVLDPACGSGVFLVETLRKLIEQFFVTHQGENVVRDKELVRKSLKDIVINNIFGIDKDESAVQVAIFSVYLTLLDYMNPPEIEGFKFPKLLDTNFFHADFFDENADFNALFEKKKIQLNYIIGNPPWMRGKGEKKKTGKEPLHVKYIEGRKSKEKSTPAIDIGNKEIAQAFLLRSSDFSASNTKCALIVTSTALYSLQSADFRKYFLSNYFIERVFELASVRREVFDKSNDKAISPACVLFFSYAGGKSTDLNMVEHIALKPSHFFSLFKIFTITRHDIQSVQQDRLKRYDWLWKILVYGSYLDFNFIQRLKNDYLTIGSIVNDENEFIIKQGMKKKDDKKEIDVSELVGWEYVDTGAKSKKLQPYFIIPDLEKWTAQKVGYVYRRQGKIVKDIYMPPAALIKDGLTSDFKTVAALLSKKGVFTDNVTSLKPITPQAERLLANIVLLLNSELNAYWALQTGSFVGIKQERSHDLEKFSFPFIEISESSKLLTVAGSLKENLYRAKKENFFDANLAKMEKQLDKVLFDIDDLIAKAINLTDVERELLSYAKDVTMHHVKRRYSLFSDTIKLHDAYLTDYASLFADCFKSKFGSTGKKFVVEIWYSKQIIGMLFKVIPSSEYVEDIVWINKQDDTTGMLLKIAELGATKITDQLFVQKDIRGFEKESFYIFKPNEKRLWHKAIGHLDVYEFVDAILKAGRDKA
jgi:hypothetical protein